MAPIPLTRGARSVDVEARLQPGRQRLPAVAIFRQFIFLKKRMRARVFESTPISPRGSRSWRMTRDDSVQIAATSPVQGRGRAHAATRVSVGRRSMQVVVVPVDRQAPIAQNAGSASRPRRNFPACKALKTHKMRKESRFFASRFRMPAERPTPERQARRTVGRHSRHCEQREAIQTRQRNRLVGERLEVRKARRSGP
jgi:hypothetical protein